MAEWFDIAELVKVAVEDERTGVAFYSAAADKTQDDDLKKLYADLAEQERFHQKRFQKMLDGLGGNPVREQYPGEYMAYLRTMTSGRAFPDEQTAIRMLGDCADDGEALRLASRFERDTLILMNEMRGLIPRKDKPIVDELTKEEQSHLVALSEAMAKFAAR
jgi:rubrerythrin